jgi:hypothetical protein
MSGIWDAADTLIAMAGDTEAATALAREMAEDCAAAKRRRESEYWLDVAWALSWMANPQPLIAPEAPPVPGAVVSPFAERQTRRQMSATRGGAVVHRLDFAAKLPTKRASVPGLKRRLREAFERHQTGPAHPRGSKPAPKGKA